MSIGYELENMEMPLPPIDSTKLSLHLQEKLTFIPLDRRLRQYEQLSDSLRYLLTAKERGLSNDKIEELLESFYEDSNEMTYLDPESGLYRFGPRQRVIKESLGELMNKGQNVLPYKTKFEDTSKRIWVGLPHFYEMHKPEHQISAPINYDKDIPYPDEAEQEKSPLQQEGD